MNLELTDEQEQLSEAERSFLTRHDPIARVRATLDVAPVTIDPASASHAAESGLLGLLTPAVGGTQMDLAVLTEQHGYACSSLPLADLAIATWLLDHVGLADDRPLRGVALLAGRTTSPVPMAADLDGVVVVDEPGHRIAVVDAPRLTPMTTLDLTRSWARSEADPSRLEWTTLPPGAASLVRDGLALHRALDAVGAAARLLEMTVAYAGQRQQFGAPIGSFQAVKHHCADMAIAVEAGRAVLWAAASAMDEAPEVVRSRAVAAGAAYAKSAASQVAGTALQVHGGIGFTWEHDLHLFLRRIKVDEAFDGTVAEHRAALVSLPS
jgi:alkylation response protein AidB-like acyl-CoA dehydrogenase